MRTLSILFLSLFVLVACSSDSGPSGEDRKPGDGVVGEDGIALDVDTDEILGKEYYLKGTLSFANVPYNDRVFGKGTSIERSVRVFTLSFQNQKRVDKSNYEVGESFCTLRAETSVATKPSEVKFDQGYLRKGSVTESVSEKTKNNKSVKEVTFSLFFQTDVFQGFFLNCVNTVNSTQIAQHLGHLLDVTDKKPIPTTPVVKTVKPKSISVQYTSEASDPAFPSINHVISINKKDLPKEKRFHLDMNVYLSYPGGKRQKLAGPIRVHNPVDMVTGPLLFNFQFGKDDGFANDVINRLRLVQYEFVTAENRGLRIDMKDICNEFSSSFLDLSKSGMGCPQHIPSTLMTKTMFVAAKACTDDQFSPTNVGKVAKRQKNGRSRPSGKCSQLIWDLLEDGLTSSQVTSVHFFAKNAAKSGRRCDQFRSHIGYRYIKDVESQDALIFGRDSVTPVSDEDLYELCLAMNS